MKQFRNLILALVLLSVLFPIQRVRADMAPPPAPWLTGLEPFEYADTKVQMMYERVEIEIKDVDTPEFWDENTEVFVTASFFMRNQGTTDETMQSIFPADSLSSCAGDDSIDSDSFEVTVDGVVVPTKIVITPHPYEGDERLVYPESCSQMRWIGFTVTFPVNTDVVVIVKYTMQMMSDGIEKIDYILETGAAWYGPIKQADIIARFPYATTPENIFSGATGGTTMGYKMSYNEISWSYKNIEPTTKDNIRITTMSPSIWESIYTKRKLLKEDPTRIQTWLDLISVYESMASLGSVYSMERFTYGIRSSYYYSLIEPTFQQAITANPNNADLHAFYANFILSQCCIIGPTHTIADNDLNKILKQVNFALALDPEQSTAKLITKNLISLRSGLTLTPPPTIPATATPAISETPTPTPSPTLKPEATPTIMVRLIKVTVVQTHIVTASSIITALPTVAAALSETPIPDVVPAKSASSVPDWLVGLGLLVFGFVGGALTARRKKPD